MTCADLSGGRKDTRLRQVQAKAPCAVRQREGENTMADPDDKGSKTYALYSSLRRFFEPLREHWDKLSPQEKDIVIKEVEAFLDSVRSPKD